MSLWKQAALLHFFHAVHEEPGAHVARIALASRHLNEFIEGRQQNHTSKIRFQNLSRFIAPERKRKIVPCIQTGMKKT